MTDFLAAFFDVVLFPVDPVNLDFENNPVMILLTMCVIGIGVVGLFRRLVYGWFSNC